MINAEIHAICTRIARLETERKELAAEVAKIKKDAKDKGYDAALITKTVGVMLKSGKKQREALEQHELFDTYLSAVGLLRDDAGEPVRGVTSDEKTAETANWDIEPDAPEERTIDRRSVIDLKQPPGIDDLPSHDPTTGEITETVCSSQQASPGAAAEDGTQPLLPSSAVLMPDIPEPLDRRLRA